jgi:hypothetical protein
MSKIEKTMAIILFSIICISGYHLVYDLKKPSTYNPKASTSANHQLIAESTSDNKEPPVKQLENFSPPPKNSLLNQNPITKPAEKSAPITQELPNTPAPISTSEENHLQITLKINESIQNFPLKKDSTVYDLMTEAQKLNFITFRTKTYPFGEMIEEINNISNDKLKGTYWTYYLNDQFAQKGISDQKLINNDKVEWRYGK